jgi:hypothetical protein
VNAGFLIESFHWPQENDMALVVFPLEDRILDLCRSVLDMREENGDVQPMLDQLQDLLHQHAEQVRHIARETIAALPKGSISPEATLIQPKAGLK